MDNVKIILTVYTEGASFTTEEKTVEHTVKMFNRKTKTPFFKKVKEKVLVRVPSECKQSIKLTREAYDAMLNSVSKGVKPNQWKALSVEERLKYHLEKYSSYLGGKRFSFEILED